MPGELVINRKTGFLDGGNDNNLVVFGSDKKLMFLELADKCRRETGKWPEISSICDAVDISIRTFYKHIQIDQGFKTAWEERLLRGEAVLTSKLANMNNPIGPLSVLRRYFPQRWNPEYKVTVQHDENVVTHTAVDAELVLEAEVLPALKEPGSP